MPNPDPYEETQDEDHWRLPTFRIRPIAESDIEQVVVGAGGARAHPNADRRSQRGADFVLGRSVIELKILEDEGLAKPERQQKLAALFQSVRSSRRRPVIVLDPSILDENSKHSYHRILEGPVKKAVSSARQQLRQSRTELGSTTCILWVINNGYSALSHDTLVELVTRRARNDSSEIDAVVVSGCYHYSDGFDSYFFWPIDSVPIHIEPSFAEFQPLRDSWHRFVNERMTALVRNPPGPAETKGPVVDVSFEVDGITYLMPTPPMGKKSDFFAYGRPRRNSSGVDGIPPVATVFPRLDTENWNEFRRRQPLAVEGTQDHMGWQEREARAKAKSTLPFVPVAVTYTQWWEWARAQPRQTEVSLSAYAATVFQKRILQVIKSAKDRSSVEVLPRRYLFLVTEVFGQDMAHDTSHLGEIWTDQVGKDHVQEIWAYRRMFFEHALAAAAAEALSRGVEVVLWEKERTYAWE